MFKENFFTQYEKNYSLLKRNLQRVTPPSLNFEYIKKMYSSMLSKQDFAKSMIPIEGNKKHDGLYVFLSLLSIYEVKGNLNHFNFVSISPI